MLQAWSVDVDMTSSDSKLMRINKKQMHNKTVWRRREAEKVPCVYAPK